MIATILATVLAFTPTSSAMQTCYLVGYSEFDMNPWQIYPGADEAYVWAEAGIETNSPNWGDSSLPITCNAVIARANTYFTGHSYQSCYQGAPDGWDCMNNSAYGGSKWTAAAGMYYNQGGYYGIWDEWGQYRYWTGNPSVGFTLHTGFSSSKSANFGDPPPDPASECVANGGTWDPYEQLCWYSPIVIALDSQRFKFSSPEDGVDFDMDGDGVLERMSWTLAGENLAFLALDRNGNGTIDNGTELFGDSTLPGVSNGFTALRQLSNASRGRLDADDELFRKLLLWVDKNHDGVSQPGELRPFGELFYEIHLGFTKSNRQDGNGNEFRYRGSVLSKGNKPLRQFDIDDRRAHEKAIYDVFLRGFKQ